MLLINPYLLARTSPDTILHLRLITGPPYSFFCFICLEFGEVRWVSNAFLGNSPILFKFGIFTLT